VFTYPPDLLLRGDAAAGVPGAAASAANAASAPFLGASAP
jgi:hypothetical protein